MLGNCANTAEDVKTLSYALGGDKDHVLKPHERLAPEVSESNKDALRNRGMAMFWEFDNTASARDYLRMLDGNGRLNLSHSRSNPRSNMENYFGTTLGDSERVFLTLTAARS